MTYKPARPPRLIRFTGLISLPAILAGFALLWLAPPASAHVTVNPAEASKGGFAKLAFRVPNERDNAGTVKLEVTFPTEHPLASVSVRPHPGWTVAVEKAPLAEPIQREGRDPVTEAVSKLTWTGGPIKPGEFDEFEISVGPLPEEPDELVFKAVQTYEGGEVVRWIEEQVAGGEEPEHPAPVLKLVEGGEDAHSAPAADTAAAEESAGTASDDDVDSAQALAVTALVVGALGLLVGLGSLVRQRRAPTPPSSPAP